MKNSLYVMLNEVKHLYYEDPSLALRMTGRIVSGWQVTNIVTRWRYAKFPEANSREAFSGTTERRVSL